MSENSKQQRDYDLEEPKADLIEIFSSYQGEGLFVGAKQVFVRFAGCNLDCSFCDTKSEATIRGATVEDVLKSVMEFEKNAGKHHSVSLTGGEPLLHVCFLEHLLPRLGEKGFKTYLETNGILSRELERIIDHIDIVAMDIKLPSSTGMKPFWEEHSEFLGISKKKDVFIKVVVNENTQREDVVKARDLVEKCDHKVPFIIQPASIDDKGTSKITKKTLLELLNLSEERLSSVRVIPQVQKFLSIK